ncbi:MAG TPA: hypothetical protein DCE41_06905 [Cytophagales bacterium]|nr:hypothetical protein [Cytophagales bacterium]HAA19642.1 hypothetical protein [Cytophagales bacterium]HAP60227.1 hypothetical protein [Cytophagales bacterium]
MSDIHYFQRYSQPENMATNNTLLLFSRLYHDSPSRFQTFLNALLDDRNVPVGLSFSQQTRTGNSVPDGLLVQESIKVVIEAKRNAREFYSDQIKRHQEAFGEEQHKLMLLVAPGVVDGEQLKQIRKETQKGVTVLSTTFEAICTAAQDSVQEYDVELQEVINDYADYCESADLIEDNTVIRCLPCGDSLPALW